MTSPTNHHSSQFVKLLLLGDAKSGKTTSLVSLVKAGYKLRILDLDNLLDSFIQRLMRECPKQAENVEFRTIRDKYKMTAQGAIIDGIPKAFGEAVKLLDTWKYTDDDGAVIDFGKPTEWGPDCILVLDSLSRFCDAAFDWRVPLTPKSAKTGESHGAATYGDAQDAVEYVLASITSKSFETNVIVIAHGVYMTLTDRRTKIFPQGVGQKLSPKIPQYFPNYIRYTNIGERRTIQLTSDPIIDLANSKPFDMPKSLPADTGLADFFAILRDAPAIKPTLIKRA